MFLPEKTDEVIAERAALFTWDDKSMNHLFQHCSAVAPGGMILPPNTHTHTHHILLGESLPVCCRIDTIEPFWCCLWSCVYISGRACGWSLQVYLSIKVCVHACVRTYVRTRASIPRGPLIFPALLYERSGSERAADVEALTFLVAAARARVKRHPAPQSTTSASAHTDPRAHASTSGAWLMNRLTTDHTRHPIRFSPRRLQPPELWRPSKRSGKMADMRPKRFCYTLEIGRSKRYY